MKTMMMKMTPIRTTATIAALLLGLCSTAAATTFYPNGFYAGLGIGGGNLSSDNYTCDSGSCSDLGTSTSPKSQGAVGATMHLGYSLHSVPVQLELSYQFFYQFSTDQSDFLQSGDTLTTESANQAVFANIILNGNLNFPVIPYILAGYGANFNAVKTDYTPDASSSKTSTNNTQLEAAWQAGIGVYYRVTPNLAFNVNYKYQNLGKVTWKADISGTDTQFSSKNLINNQAEIGLTYFIGDQHQPPSLLLDS